MFLQYHGTSSFCNLIVYVFSYLLPYVLLFVVIPFFGFSSSGSLFGNVFCLCFLVFPYCLYIVCLFLGFSLVLALWLFRVCFSPSSLCPLFLPFLLAFLILLFDGLCLSYLLPFVVFLCLSSFLVGFLPGVL